MNIKETESILKSNLPLLIYEPKYDSGNDAKPYFVNNLSRLREAIDNLEGIGIISDEITYLKNSPLFQNFKDQDTFSSMDNLSIDDTIKRLKIGIPFLLRYTGQIENPEDGLFIKLPEIQTFDDLSKVSNELKKAIEIPVNDLKDGSFVKIETAESGSIWLIISLGTISAVNLVGAICWSAAVLKKKKAEAKIFEEHARTLELKNEALSSLVSAQNEQLKNVLEGEAEEIANKYYSIKDPEVINRLKLSINTVNDLIDRGTKILPSTDNKEVLSSFPDLSKINLIESTIKKLQNEN